MNILRLSEGLIQCTVVTEHPLPSAAYAALRSLVEACDVAAEQVGAVAAAVDGRDDG